MSVLQKAGLAHTPVNPSTGPNSTITATEGTRGPLTVPGPEDRHPIEAIMTELEQQAWYKDQIVSRRAFEPRGAQTGTSRLSDLYASCLGLIRECIHSESQRRPL